MQKKFGIAVIAGLIVPPSGPQTSHPERAPAEGPDIIAVLGGPRGPGRRRDTARSRAA